MPSYSLSHLADHVLLRDLARLLAQERATTAQMLAHLAEVDARKLYLPAAAGHKSKAEIALLLAEGFPQPDLATSFEPLGRGVAAQHAPEHVDEHTGEHAPGHVERAESRAKVVPLSPERYALQINLEQGAQDKLCYAKALLGHALPSGEVAQVLDRALDALIEQLERRGDDG